jgi:hypothetical protein
MKLMIVMLAALLALAVQPAAAQTTYTVMGPPYQCIDGEQKGEIAIYFQFQNRDAPTKGKVQFKERVPWPKQPPPKPPPPPVCNAETGKTTGPLVYELLTDNNVNTFKIERFCPNRELVVCGSGGCGPKREIRDTIRATIKPNEVTIECTGQKYTAKGKPHPPIIFKSASGFEDEPKLSDGPDRKLWWDDEWVMVETGKKIAPPKNRCFATEAEKLAEFAKIYEDGIAITVKCKQNPHVVQFVHEKHFRPDGTLEAGEVLLSDPTTDCGVKGSGSLTTNPKVPAWRTDKRTGPSPYYGWYLTDCDSNTIYDVPTFGGFNAEKYHLWRKTFVTFVLCNGEVVRQVNWTRETRSKKWHLQSGIYYNVEKPMAPDQKLLESLQSISKEEGFHAWPEPACDKMGQPDGP